MKKRVSFVMFLVLVLVAFLALVGCQTLKPSKTFIGVGISGSGPLQKERVTHVVVHPQYGANLGNRAQIFLEGDVGSVQGAFQLGLSGIVGYKFLRLSKNSYLFVEGGPGIAWWSGSPYSDKFVSVDSLLGTAKLRAGIWYYISEETWIKVGGGWTHYSSIRDKDKGDDSVGGIVQIEGLNGDFFSKIFKGIANLFKTIFP